MYDSIAFIVFMFLSFQQNRKLRQKKNVAAQAPETVGKKLTSKEKTTSNYAPK